MQKGDVFQDRNVRKIVVVSIGLAVSFGFGTLAALRVNSAGFSFGWHWSLPIVVSIGLFLNWKFWNAVWQLQDRPSTKARRKLVLYLAGFCVLAAGSFLYPIQFIQQAQRSGVVEGLVHASIFLSILGLLIYGAGKMFGSIDNVELKRMDQPKV